MPSAEQRVRTYRELAEDYGRQGQAQMRDRFLVLAADAALAAGQKDEAERLRGRLLQHNPHHLLKPYSSFAEAMESVDVQNYVGALRRSHPFEKAESLLEGLRRKAEHAPAGEARTPPRSPASPEMEPGIKAEAAKGREDLKVFRVVDGGAPAASAKPVSPGASAPSARPVQSTPSSPSPPPARPGGAPESLPLRREPYPMNISRADLFPERGNRDPSAGAWVSTGLFFLVLLMGIVLAAYTLVRPFLPQAWFP
jgi:hypothetical protein